MMFTPQKKGWSFTPRSSEKNGLLSNPRSLRGSVYGKGKAIVDSDLPPLPPPPQGFLMEKGCDAGENSVETQVWKSFTEAGMLDEASLLKKDKEALIDKVARLETELYDYQYNMGLLLMEKKEWMSKYKDFDERLGEAEMLLKREQASHLIAISEMEKREENLRKALDVEKQCVVDLENSLREMLSQQADVKSNSDANLAEARALKESFEDKSLKVESKLHAADARLAEVCRKNSEVERKLHDLAVREEILQREQASLSKEKAFQFDDIAKQREDLKTWEKSLHDGQERLVNNQRILNQREMKFNDSDNAVMRKEREIEIMKQTVDMSNASLKEKENYINLRLTALAAKEKDIEIQFNNIQKKEKELIAKEEILNNREAVEIQKLVDENKSDLNSKLHDFEIELSKKRELFDEEQKGKLVSIEEMDSEIKQKEESILKREQALENEIEIFNAGKKERDMKEKELKKLEKDFKTEEIKLQKKTKQYTEDYQRLLILKEEIDVTKKAVETENLRLISQQDSLKLTEKERAEHIDLQLKLKLEIEECRNIKESLAAEQKELRGEREKFEKEWETLDEKTSALVVDTKKVANEREYLDKWKHAEELKLKNEQQVAEDEIQKKAADLKLKKEAFDANTAHERSEIFEMLQRERADMVRELDLLKHEIEIDMQKKLQDLESDYRQKETEFNDQKNRELDRIKILRDLSASETQKMKTEQNSLENAKHEYIIQRKKLEEDQEEIRGDIGTLLSLNKSLKEHREEFIKERESFLSQKCKGCGVQVELVISALRPVNEIVNPDNVRLSSLANFSACDPKQNNASDFSPVANISQSSGSRFSWMKRCREKIFKISPGKVIEDSADNVQAENSKVPDKPAHNAGADDIGVTEAPRYFIGALKDDEVLPRSVENSAEIQRNETDNGIPETISQHDTFLISEKNKSRSLSPLAEEGFKSQTAKPKSRRSGRSRPKKKISEKTDNDDSHGDSIHTENTISLGRKRNFSQTSGNLADDVNSESLSESISLGGRRKKRQTVAPEPQPVREKRYNFRKSTLVGTNKAVQALSLKTKGKTKSRQQSEATSLATNEHADDILQDNEGLSKYEPNFVPSLLINENLSQSKTPAIEKVEDVKVTKIENVAEHSGRDMSKLNAEESIPPILAEQNKRASETESSGDFDFDSDSEQESDLEEHNPSVSKKLWKFFTS